MIVKIGNSEADVRVEAVLSTPRVGFTSNFFCWAQALMPLGIRPTLGTGAFWSQVLTRCFENFIDQCEYLLVIDFDSFFLKEDVERLFALAMTFQCDALTGLQCKREDGRPMLTLKDTLHSPPADGISQVSREWFGAPVQEVDTAHFGLTIISTAALKRTRRPWFWSKPSEDGTWGDQRLDDDIFFWKNFRESGNKVFITPRVTIGHGEYVITWPGQSLGSPVFQWTTEFNNERRKPPESWSIGQ